MQGGGPFAVGGGGVGGVVEEHRLTKRDQPPTGAVLDDTWGRSSPRRAERALAIKRLLTGIPI